MRKIAPDTPTRSSSNKHLIVAVGPGPSGMELVRAGKDLANAMGRAWQAVHVEIPYTDQQAQEKSNVSKSLALAARLGAAVAVVPAATPWEGLIFHLKDVPTDHLVIGNGTQSGRLFAKRSVLDEVRRCHSDLTIHIIPVEPHENARIPWIKSERSTSYAHAYAVAMVAFTIGLALLLHQIAGLQFLSFLFLFPVITAGARMGTGPAVSAAVLSSIGFNFFFLEPAFSLDPFALQSWVMMPVLVGIALYTGALTSGLRGRIALSERSARENAGIAAFALELTRVSDWTSTTQTICTEISALMQLQTAVVREVSGLLEVASWAPIEAKLEPLDRAALDSAWTNGEPAGSGTAMLSAANWQFRPLKTSLGMLAVVGLARDDGRDPVSPDREVLLATLTAQAALALERLRLEDLMRTGNYTASKPG